MIRIRGGVEAMYVCICNAVTEREIRSAVGEGVTTMRQLKHELGVADCCGKCADCARSVLNDELSNQSEICATGAYAQAA
jgi:bacterioferritin-associated ferredoxin